MSSSDAGAAAGAGASGARPDDRQRERSGDPDGPRRAADARHDGPGGLLDHATVLGSLRRHHPTVLATGLLVVVGLLYWETLYPGVGGRLNPGDSAKFQYVGEILGVPHEPGFPQYVVLNHLWTRLPIPMELATRVNLLSGFFSLVAGLLFYDALRRMARSAWVAALATASLLLSRDVWLVSTEAEVYSLHLLWVAAVLWTGERWWSTRDRGWLLGLVAAGAFSFGNHPLAATLALGVVGLIVGTEPRLLARPRFLAASAGIVAVAASQYLFLLARSHSGVHLLEGIRRDAGLADLARAMSGARFTAEHGMSGGWGTTLQRLGELGGAATQQLGPAVLALAALGAGHLLLRRRGLAALVILPGLATAGLVGVYHIGDWQGYVPPIWAALTALAAVGVGALPGGRPVRGLVLALWAVVLVPMVGPTRADLRVESNPWDRVWLLEQASPADLVVTFVGDSYAENRVHDYYRHGLDESERPEVALAQDVFAGDFAFVRPGTIYLPDGDPSRWFRQHGADLLPGRVPGAQPRAFLRSATRDPVRELGVSPGPGGLTVSLRGGPVIRPAEPVQALVIGGTDARVKGVVRYGWEDGSPAGEHPVRELARHLPDGDWYCVVLAADDLRSHRRTTRRIAAAFGVRRPGRLNARQALLLVGRKGAPRSRMVALVDPRRPVDIPLRRR